MTALDVSAGDLPATRTHARRAWALVPAADPTLPQLGTQGGVMGKAQAAKPRAVRKAVPHGPTPTWVGLNDPIGVAPIVARVVIPHLGRVLQRVGLHTENYAD